MSQNFSVRDGLSRMKSIPPSEHTSSRPSYRDRSVLPKKIQNAFSIVHVRTNKRKHVQLQS